MDELERISTLCVLIVEDVGEDIPTKVVGIFDNVDAAINHVQTIVDADIVTGEDGFDEWLDDHYDTDDEYNDAEERKKYFNELKAQFLATVAKWRKLQEPRPKPKGKGKIKKRPKIVKIIKKSDSDDEEGFVPMVDKRGFQWGRSFYVPTFAIKF